MARSEGGIEEAAGDRGLLGLPFREIWCVDFEFQANDGNRPTVHCMVAKEVRSGRLLRLWADELGDEPPFDIGPESLFVAYFASAEMGCFLSLGWELPARVLDLFVEFRCMTNGKNLTLGRGLIGALAHHGLSSIPCAEKEEMRELAIRGGPFTEQEKLDLLDYCQTDVDALPPLLERILLHVNRTELGLGQALLRGRYMRAVAHMEHVGVPMDVEYLEAIRASWDDIKLGLIEEVDKDFGVYQGTSFIAAKFVKFLERTGLPWPVLESGSPKLDSDTFRDMSKAYPQLAPLKELRSSLGELRLNSIQVGSDGRNRTLISPFSSRSGRNQPSNSRFVFGPSVWIRNLIVAPEGRALAYLDWKSQEVWIAAVLSGDEAMMASLLSGDPYLSFAKMSGLAPEDATKATHGDVRDQCKTAVLGTNYGMGPDLLRTRTGLTRIAARDVLDRLRRVYPVYFKWVDRHIDRAQLELSMNTCFGWTQHVVDGLSPNAIRNFPMQAHGAEMMRLAACLLTEAGIDVCAPIHDAFLIEGPEETIADTIELASKLMREASAVILGGVEVGVDAKVIMPGERYSDERGTVMWAKVCELTGLEP